MSTQISRQSFEFSFIRNRIELHPSATAIEIAASLELDGVRVSAERVRDVMDHIRHNKDRTEARFPPATRSHVPSSAATRQA
ncbi:MAG TPA: hypothetical protein VHB99_01895 [Pirellulales bacterium]|nr:hypothetical protein [Pirellulales bacterium]